MRVPEKYKIPKFPGEIASRRVILISIIALILGFIFFDHFDFQIFTNTDSVRQWISGFGPVAPVIYILLMALAIVIVPIPDFVIGLAAAFLFPWYLAGVYTLIADFIGSTITYYLARWYGRPMVVRFVKNEQLVLLDELLRKNGLWIIFVMRLIPGFNFDLIGYGTGLTSISYGGYILVTMLGILPRRFGTYFLLEQSIRIHPMVMLAGIILSMLFVPVIAYWLWIRYRNIVKNERIQGIDSHKRD